MQTPPLRIDAHHHLWTWRPAGFEWLDDSMQALRRDFTPADLRREMHTAGIDASIAVQTLQTLGETEFLLDCADAAPAICAVVGWFPLLDDALSAHLDRFSSRPKLAGVREIVQGRPAGFLDQPAFDRGIRALTARGLTYDILIRENQLAEATRLVDRHPHQRFVLDHAAKPLIAAGELHPWREDIAALAHRDNVACKLSGLVTEAVWSRWSLDTLRPYLDACVETFGPARLIAGSDWPVCLVASTYARWWATLDDYFAPFTLSERQSIFGITAAAFYNVHPETKT
jgi:L-fuconolactonase